MTAYLGPTGGLVSFRCPSAVSISASRPISYRTTLGGRVKAQLGPRSRREWSVNVETALPHEIRNLQALVEGGTPPWVWVEPYAMVTNMFSPEQSLMMPGSYGGSGLSEGGAVTVDGAFSPRSVSHPDGATVDFGYRDGSWDRPVVVPGVRIAVSAYVRGSGVLGISWRDWNNNTISEDTNSYSHSQLQRVVMTRTPPAGAATVRVWVSGARQAAMPALTYTPEVADWSIGRGCKRVVVEGLSEVVQHAVPDLSYMRRSGLSFTVREVG